MTIRVALPAHLRTLAHIDGEVKVEIAGQATQRSVLDALEASYPMLQGTIRDHVTQERRAYLRFFACEEDVSHESPDAPLPDAVATGAEPFLIIGAVAGGFLPDPGRSSDGETKRTLVERNLLGFGQSE
jgi:sulfur-carrier protein